MLTNRRTLVAADRSRRHQNTVQINFQLLQRASAAESDIINLIQESDFFRDFQKAHPVIFPTIKHEASVSQF